MHVCIIGGGIIGLMAAEFAKLNGANYVALLETNEKRGKKALKYKKVDEYYNAMDTNAINLLLEKTNGGFDKVIECCGNSPAVSEAIMTVKPGGTIVLVGVSLEPITIPTVVINLIATKQLNVEKYIDAKVPLSKAQESFTRLTSGTDDAIKIIFKPEKNR